MLAGAHGIDLVLFIVAADDGVMPQTEEHLDILHLLGVRRGIFVITKIDLVDAARVATVREEIEILALDTSARRRADRAPCRPSTAGGSTRCGPRSPPSSAVPPRRGAAKATSACRSTAPSSCTATASSSPARRVAGEIADGDTVRVLPRGTIGARARARGARRGRGARRPRPARRAQPRRRRAGRGRARRRRVRRTSRARDAHDSTRVSRCARARASRSPTTAVSASTLGTAEVLAQDRAARRRSRAAPAERGLGAARAARADRRAARRSLHPARRDGPLDARRWRRRESVRRPPPARRDGARHDARAVAHGQRRDGGARPSRDGARLRPSTRAPWRRRSAMRIERAVAALALVDDAIPLPIADGPDASWTTLRKWDRFAADRARRGVGRSTAPSRWRPGSRWRACASQLPWEVTPKRVPLGHRPAGRRRGGSCATTASSRLPTHRVALDADARDASAALERLLAEGGLHAAGPAPARRDDRTRRARGARGARRARAEGRVVRDRARSVLRPGRRRTRRSARLAAICRAHGEITAAGFRDLIGASRKFAIAFLDWCDRTGVTLRIGDARRLRR